MALGEHPCSVPTIHLAAHNPCISSSRGSDVSFDLHGLLNTYGIWIDVQEHTYTEDQINNKNIHCTHYEMPK